MFLQFFSTLSRSKPLTVNLGSNAHVSMESRGYHRYEVSCMGRFRAMIDEELVGMLLVYSLHDCRSEALSNDKLCEGTTASKKMSSEIQLKQLRGRSSLNLLKKSSERRTFFAVNTKIFPKYKKERFSKECSSEWLLPELRLFELQQANGRRTANSTKRSFQK